MARRFACAGRAVRATYGDTPGPQVGEDVVGRRDMQAEGLRLCSALRGERSGINDASRRHPRQRRSVRTLLRDGLIVVPVRIASVSRFWKPDPSDRVRNILDDWRRKARDIVRWIGAIRVRFRSRPGAG